MTTCRAFAATSLTVTLQILALITLLCGPAAIAAEIDTSSGGSGFGAPDGSQLTAARELPERLHVVTLAGTSKPAATPAPQATKAGVEAVDEVFGAPPLFLVHCAFLC